MTDVNRGPNQNESDKWFNKIIIATAMLSNADIVVLAENLLSE